MKRLFSSSYWWLYLIIILLGINGLASVLHFRIDLTQEKRFTLSPATKKLLARLPGTVNITVFLSGDMPAGFKKLSNSTTELLQEFREYGHTRIVFRTEKPGEGLDDSTKKAFIDSLYRLGIKPTNVKATAKAGEAEEQRLVFPGALVTYKDRAVGIDLLQGQSAVQGLNALNNAEALLEYKFASAIQKITANSAPVVGYLLGNGEPLTYNVYDLIERTLKPNYAFGFLPIDSVKVIPPNFDALMIVKPVKPFSDEQKLKIDQYVMHGGKVIWLIDNLYAEMDSLMRTQSDFVAFDRGLNLEDQLFKYGVRINQDLLQDLQCDKMPLVVGNYGNQPQMQLVPWYYFPALSGNGESAITKNLDNVLSIFPNSIDTVKAPGIQKTILLSSSANARTLSTPAIVSLNSVKTADDYKLFNRSHVPVAVLLEGKFSSVFANRISTAVADSLTAYGAPFVASAASPSKMIVISDGDIVTNVVTKNEGPLPMGFNQFTQYQYANKDFILNAVEYLVNPSGILETRSKDYTLRLLDPRKTDEERTFWQFINIVVPVLLIIIFALIYQWLRKRKYAR